MDPREGPDRLFEAPLLARAVVTAVRAVPAAVTIGASLLAVALAAVEATGAAMAATVGALLALSVVMRVRAHGSL